MKVWLRWQWFVLGIFGLVTFVRAQSFLEPAYSLRLDIEPSSVVVWTDTSNVTELLITDAKKNILVIMDPLSGNKLKTIPYFGLKEFTAESLKKVSRDAELAKKITDLQQQIDQLNSDAKIDSNRADSARTASAILQREKDGFDQDVPALTKTLEGLRAAVVADSEAAANANEPYLKIKGKTDTLSMRITEQNKVIENAKKNTEIWRATDKITRYKGRLDTLKPALDAATSAKNAADLKLVQSQKKVDDTQRLLDEKKARYPLIVPTLASLSTLASQSDQAKTKALEAASPLISQVYSLQADKAKNLQAMEQLTYVEKPRGLAVVTQNGKSYLFLAAQGTRRVNVFLLPELKVVGILGNGQLTAPSEIAIAENKLWVLDDAGTDNAAIKTIDFVISDQGVTGSSAETFTGIQDAKLMTDLSVDATEKRLYVSFGSVAKGRVDIYNTTGGSIGSLGISHFDNGAISLALWDNFSGGYLWALDGSFKYRIYDRKTLRSLVVIIPNYYTEKIKRLLICHKPIAGYQSGLVIAVAPEEKRILFYDRSFISAMFGMEVSPY